VKALPKAASDSGGGGGVLQGGTRALKMAFMSGPDSFFPRYICAKRAFIVSKR
jgi:hypothetical protein